MAATSEWRNIKVEAIKDWCCPMSHSVPLLYEVLSDFTSLRRSKNMLFEPDGTFIFSVTSWWTQSSETIWAFRPSSSSLLCFRNQTIIYDEGHLVTELSEAFALISEQSLAGRRLQPDHPQSTDEIKILITNSIKSVFAPKAVAAYKSCGYKCSAEKEFYLPTWWAPQQWWWVLQPSAGQPDQTPPSSPRLEREHTHALKHTQSQQSPVHWPGNECKFAIALKPCSEWSENQTMWHEGAEATWCKFSSLVSVIKAKWEQRSAETVRAESLSNRSLGFSCWQHAGSCSIPPITGLKALTQSALQPLTLCCHQKALQYLTYPPGLTVLLISKRWASPGFVYHPSKTEERRHFHCFVYACVPGLMWMSSKEALTTHWLKQVGLKGTLDYIYSISTAVNEAVTENKTSMWSNVSFLKCSHFADCIRWQYIWFHCCITK